MAQVNLDQSGKSSSSAGDNDDDGDVSTSSEEENVLAGNSSLTNAMNIDHEQMDSPNSVTKPRIKLNLRASMTAAGSGAAIAPSHGVEFSNGHKEGLHAAASAEAKETKLPRGPKAVAAVKAASPPVQAAESLDTSRPDSSTSNTPPPQAVEVQETRIKSENENSHDHAVATAAVSNALTSLTNKNAVKAEAAVETDEQFQSEGPGEEAAEGSTEEAKIGDQGTNTHKAKAEPSLTNGTAVVSLGKALPSSVPSTKKVKKKLPKLPLSMKRKLPLKGNNADSSAAVVTAKVVDDNSKGGTDVVATPIPILPKGGKPDNNSNAKRKVQTQSKVIKLPPLTSPGLLIPQSNAGAVYQPAKDPNSKKGLAAPAVIFEQSMAAAGYTTEARTNHPHRGSSVKREIGDMFDSNIAFTLNFPSLVPKELWSEQQSTDNTGSTEEASSGKAKVTLPQLLLKSLEKDAKTTEKPSGETGSSRKRRRPWQFSDMMPVSLTAPYPSEFLQRRLNYVKAVQEREKYIIAFQDTQDQLEIAQEEQDLLLGKVSESEPNVVNPVKIPPIPFPPSPPRLSEFDGVETDQFEDQHPIYLPKGKQNFVAHLDKKCFHATEGRYAWLQSNYIADPQFVGASAPGISGLTLSSGSGLATASSSGVSIGATGSSQPPLPPPDLSSSNGGAVSCEKKEVVAKKPAKKTASLPAPLASKSQAKFKLNHAGPTPTGTIHDLRMIMELRGELAVKMKECIIMAAVHASRSGKHSTSFLAPDGKAYPEVNKAFQAFSDMKPCARCKGNKQGAYHCRLRRKHTEADYDGGDSMAKLRPLLALPMEDLLVKPKPKKKKKKKLIKESS